MEKEGKVGRLAHFVLERADLFYDRRAKTLKEALLNPAARSFTKDAREAALICFPDSPISLNSWFLNQWIDFDVDILPRWVCKDREPVKVETYLNLYVYLWFPKLYETEGIIRTEKSIFDFPFNPAVFGLGLREYHNYGMVLSYRGENLSDFVLRLVDVPTVLQMHLEKDLLSKIVNGAVERIGEADELKLNGFRVEPVGNIDYTEIVFSFSNSGNPIEIRAAVERPPLTEVCKSLEFNYL